jgi:hypothetical protein
MCIRDSYSGAMSQTQSAIAQFLGDGNHYWGGDGINQDSHPELYYRSQSIYGGAEGYTDISASTVGQYLIRYGGVPVDYCINAMYKHSTLPSDIDQSKPFLYELSLDNGITWLTGAELHPLQAEKMNRPMVWGLKNNGGTKHAILACYQRNKHDRVFSFLIRHSDFGTKSITVEGQYPSLIIFQ